MVLFNSVSLSVEITTLPSCWEILFVEIVGILLILFNAVDIYLAIRVNWSGNAMKKKHNTHSKEGT